MAAKIILNKTFLTAVSIFPEIMFLFYHENYTIHIHMLNHPSKGKIILSQTLSRFFLAVS